MLNSSRHTRFRNDFESLLPINGAGERIFCLTNEEQLARADVVRAIKDDRLRNKSDIDAWFEDDFTSQLVFSHDNWESSELQALTRELVIASSIEVAN